MTLGQLEKLALGLTIVGVGATSLAFLVNYEIKRRTRLYEAQSS